MNPLAIAPWAIAAILAAGGFAYVVHCNNNARFITAQKVLAEEQVKRLQEKAARELKAKEEADAQRTKETAALQRTIKRLRDANSGPSLVPTAASCAGSTEVAAFDRAELDRALREFTAGVQELVAEGEQAVIDLDSAKGWALKLSFEMGAAK